MPPLHVVVAAIHHRDMLDGLNNAAKHVTAAACGRCYLLLCLPLMPLPPAKLSAPFLLRLGSSRAVVGMPSTTALRGRRRRGNAAVHITVTKVAHYLQTSLSSFLKLCILKGIFPWELKKKVEGNHKTYYHMKDIAFLAHDPLIEKFWDIRAHKRKIKKALAKKNIDQANRLLSQHPKYKLDRLILERYPTFMDALRDLDDFLTMVHLFAVPPAVEGERIQVERIHSCRRLSHQWQAFISRTHKWRKTFISVKGIYHQAEDAQNRSKISMSRKKRKIYEAMQISKEWKKANVDLLKERKKKAEEQGRTR
ncbi:pescadillo homolog [Dioscorea cayenensis subsp. rotundata]|uniref:Pescadillo homolog n=1 Tax=Dioscorea cayennensis subsp. rotundata TaxID=55577 RepID=A0AB40B0S0_DIOCR|nr:pescadillo homolog [Dioscorea cayenensis subsp. rotundata]